jgi:hypothetical protein
MRPATTKIVTTYGVVSSSVEGIGTRSSYKEVASASAKPNIRAAPNPPTGL